MILQSRLAALPLPARALLPIAGVPSAVLTARRVANTGLPVIVVTPDAQVDDALAEAVAAAGFRCVRGPDHDLLQLFVRAVSDLPDDGVIVRLTAENVYPDGAFVRDLLSGFERSEADYLRTDSPADGLPYGLSAEVFYVSALRQAASEARLSDDRMQVTSWIQRHRRTAKYQHPQRHEHWPRLRCTLDTFEDYQALLRVFGGVRDPVAIGWRELIGRLASGTIGGETPRTPHRIAPNGAVHSVLALGGVQLGLAYGIANAHGLPDDAEVSRILQIAADAGVTALDTARAYGASEERIGRLLPTSTPGPVRIVSKLDVLAGVPGNADSDTVISAVDESVFESLHALRKRRIDALLLHRWAHRHAWNGAAWRRLLELQRAGLIETLGASVQNPAEAIEALADPSIGQLQCPVNLLDARWRQPDFLESVAARPDVVIHARSVLLQGLLTFPPEQWPEVPGVDAEALCKTLDRLVVEMKRTDRVDLCMAYVRGLSWVTSIVVGVESATQLEANLLHVRRPPLTVSQIKQVEAGIPALPEPLLNPALWKSSSATIAR